MLKHRPFAHLDKLVREKKIKVRYPKGYQHWRKRFQTTLRETEGDVKKTLEVIHGKSSGKDAQET